MEAENSTINNLEPSLFTDARTQEETYPRSKKGNSLTIYALSTHNLPDIQTVTIQKSYSYTSNKFKVFYILVGFTKRIKERF